MRFCYLRLALLTSAFAANALADTAKKDAEMAASRTTSLPTFVRDNSTAPAVTETREPTSVDDEDRASKAMIKFAKMMGKTMDDDFIKRLSIRNIRGFINENMTPKNVYHALGLGAPTGNVLSDKRWILWAFYVYKLGRDFVEDGYEFIVAAMLSIHDAETVARILIAAAMSQDTKPLAIKLARVADDHIKSLVLDNLPKLDKRLSRQKQQTPEMIHQIRRNRIFKFLRKHSIDNMLRDEKFFVLTSYLSILRHKNNAAGTALSIFRNFSEDAALLDKLLSLQNYRDRNYLESLVSIWLDKNTPPSKIVSMLVQDKEKADQFTILFSDGLKRSFWLRYLKKYNKIKQDAPTASSNSEHLLQILLAVVEQQSPATDKYMAFTTILKILISPTTTHRHDLEMKLMSILLLNRTLPSDVLSMLMHGAAAADKYNILFVNKAAKSFWVRYLLRSNDLSSNGNDFAQVANADFQQVLIMLHAAGVPESSTIDKNLARSTILKIFISPEFTNVITARKYLEELTSNWLKNRLPPHAVVFLLLLEEKEADYFKILFTNEHSSKYWEDYTNAYYADTPASKNYKLATLIEFFGDAKLRSILEAAPTVEATSQRVKDLLA